MYYTQLTIDPRMCLLASFAFLFIFHLLSIYMRPSLSNLYSFHAIIRLDGN
jgi:hypothetical protein